MTHKTQEIHDNIEYIHRFRNQKQRYLNILVCGVFSNLGGGKSINKAIRKWFLNSFSE